MFDDLGKNDRRRDDGDVSGAGRDLGADFLAMQVRGLGVGTGENQGRRFVGLRTGGGKQVGGFVQKKEVA
ncbi:MAG: hypothetical protein ACR2Q4_19795 [Geminicoccaceae bacterium]